MADVRLSRRLEEVASRLRRVRRLKALSAAWLAAAALCGALFATGVVGVTWQRVLMLGAAALIGGWLWARRKPAEEHATAAEVERAFPDLNATLFTAVAQQPETETGTYGFLQQQVISQALQHARRRDWRETVPAGRVWSWRLWHLAALGAFACASVFALRNGPATSRIAAGLAALGAKAAAADEYHVTVEPGDTEIERGSSLLVMARFEGKLPAGVELVAVDADEKTVRIPLSKSLDDPVFGGRLPNIEADLTYRVEFEGRQSDEFRVTTFEYPRLLQADATIVHPEYTGLGQKTIEDVRRVSVLEGSTLTLTCRLNKPVVSAALIDADKQATLLAPTTDAGDVVAVTLTPTETQRYRLVLEDASGRQNKQPPEFVITVTPNQPPELRIASPRRDVRVSPLEELALKAQAWDDFGLKEYGLVFQTPKGDEQTLVLGAEAPREQKTELIHQLSFEQLAASPNELLSYYFYADDVGPDGQSRRTFSDMFFAEVRHFEEIFRQVAGQSAEEQQQQQQQQQGQQQGGPAGKLLEIQKQIVTATWNTLRRFPLGPKASRQAKFTEDVGVIAESQGDAITQANELQGQLEDVLSRQYAADAVRHMLAAHEQLQRAADETSVEPLPAARLSAQAAYQALLRLQAREHMVQNARNRSQQSQSGQQQQRQQQLDQLELKNDRNRYEQERQARQSQQEQQDQARREQSQALNRLRELAKRQEDLNQKIKELENKLREVKSEEERKELERQLKRLQEEQQEMLRDVDELRERMDRQQNRMDQAESRQQLDQTRENIRQATEALEAGQTSKALASGTRAQRELEQLRDDLRKQSAGAFDQAMEQMRQDARELADRQQEIGRELESETQPQSPQSRRPSLRPEADNREQLAQSLGQQRERLGDLLDQMRDVVEQSEESEPLLSKQLYDTMRDTRVDRPEEALDRASQLLRRGFPNESRPEEEQARRGIERIREGVEKAAEAVLGNELDSLRRAREELDQLTRSIESELAQSDPNFRAAGRNRDGEPGQQPGEPRDDQEPGAGREPREGEQPSDQQGRQPGERGQQGQRGQQPGEQPQEGQPGQQREGQQGQRGQQGQQPGQQGQRGQQPGEQPQEGQPGQQGEGQQGQRGQQGQQPGQQGQRGQPGVGQEGQQPGQQPGDQPSNSDQNGESPGEGRQPGSRGQRDGQRAADGLLSQFLQEGTQDGRGGGGPHLGPRLPLTGGEFTEWSDRMRDIEEMVADPELRGEVATIRERARDVRIEVKRHSKQPNWELVRTSIYGPMLELQQRLAEEIARRSPNERLVPIDRDPVPDRYAELVREYYERLGAGQRAAAAP